VLPNRDYISAQVIDSVIRLNERGLLPDAVAMREIQAFFQTFSDEEYQAAVAELDLEKSFLLRRPEPSPADGANESQL
jgi:hypothetical protein